MDRKQAGAARRSHAEPASRLLLSDDPLPLPMQAQAAAMLRTMTLPQAKPPRSASEQRLLDAALVDLWERRISFNQNLGLKVLSIGTEGVDGPRVAFVMRPDLVGHAQSGRLHGGVISATLDAVAGFALMVALGVKHADENAAQVMHRFSRMGTIDLRVDYLRQGIGQRFVASALVLRLGGRLASTQMRLVNEDDLLIATGAASYVLS